MFQFGEDLFDGVEVGGIGRQEQKPGAASPDGAAHRLALVATEIIEDDDVARLQRWGQNLIDKGMTLDQVKAAKPTMDYDPEYGRQPGATAQFVEAVYRSLKQKKTE